MKLIVNMERIESLAKEKGWSKREIERRAGVSVGSISKWLRVNPTQTNLKKVADALDVSVMYLTGESDYKTEQDAIITRWENMTKEGLSDEVRRIEAGIRIPVLGEVPCGIPIEAVEMLDSDEWEEISERTARTGSFFGLKVKGDSMSPRIQEGDVLIVKQQSTAESGDIVIAKVNGNDATCKKLIKQEDGIVLQAFNPDYTPMYFSQADIKEKPVVIIGKVVENRQKF